MREFKECKAFFEVLCRSAIGRILKIKVKIPNLYAGATFVQTVWSSGDFDPVASNILDSAGGNSEGHKSCRPADSEDDVARRYAHVP